VSDITRATLHRSDDHAPSVAPADSICRTTSDIRNYQPAASDSTYCANRECYVFINFGFWGPGFLTLPSTVIWFRNELVPAGGSSIIHSSLD